MSTKIRVAWYVGRSHWSADFPVDPSSAESKSQAEQRAQAKVDDLLERGWWHRSESGVITNYPPHRISKITRRVLTARAANGVS